MSVVRLEYESYRANDEEKKKLSVIWPELADPKNDWPECKPVLMNVEEIPDWVCAINAVRLKPVQHVRFQSPENPDLNKMESKEVREFVKTVNQIVFPGYELIQFNMVKNLNECCTNEVQSYLDDGWRIIAVMPQPNQRRPDYIIVKRQD